MSDAAFEQIKVNGVSCFRVDARRLLDEMRKLAKEGHTIYWRAIHRNFPGSRWIR